MNEPLIREPLFPPPGEAKPEPRKTPIVGFSLNRLRAMVRPAPSGP